MSFFRSKHEHRLSSTEVELQNLAPLDTLITCSLLAYMSSTQSPLAHPNHKQALTFAIRPSIAHTHGEYALNASTLSASTCSLLAHSAPADTHCLSTLTASTHPLLAHTRLHAAKFPTAVKSVFSLITYSIFHRKTVHKMGKCGA